MYSAASKQATSSKPARRQTDALQTDCQFLGTHSAFHHQLAFDFYCKVERWTVSLATLERQLGRIVLCAPGD